MAWKNIESAPKDGTRVIVRRKNWVEDVAVCYFSRDFDCWIPVFSLNEFFDAEEWMEIPE